MSDEKKVVSAGIAAEVILASLQGRVVLHTPPQTGKLEEQFAGSAFNSEISTQAVKPVRSSEVPRDQKSFDIAKVPDKESDVSGTQAFLSQNKKR